METLDLFSGAAGGWSLGMHRAGFRTVAACEAVEWRRALYLENNPGVKVYDDVRTLTAERLLADLGRLPSVVVGSPPCQDISSANTKGKGVEGERSGLFFEAARIIGEVRPRWFALENSANLRTRGADAVIAALEALGYACWPVVVRAGDIGANHERPRAWLIGCDLEQITDPNQERRTENGQAGGPCKLDQTDRAAADRAYGARVDADTASERPQGQSGRGEQRQAEVAERPDLPAGWEVALCPADRGGAVGPRADWSFDDLARHIRLDDGIPAWVAGTRVAVGGPRGTSAASLIVEAFGDAVVPQIPEAIGRAILRTEAALSAIYAPAVVGGASLSTPSDYPERKVQRG